MMKDENLEIGLISSQKVMLEGKPCLCLCRYVMPFRLGIISEDIFG